MTFMIKAINFTILFLAVLVCPDSGYGQIPFDLEHPDRILPLEDQLEEISALSFGKSGSLLCVQDEDGYIYELSPESGEVLNRFRFSGSGDYEGIESVDDWIFVLKSNGMLYRTVAESPSKSETSRWRLNLPRGCDAEGLGWDASSGRLIVGCKEADGVSGTKGRSLFAFDTTGNLLSDEPVAFISAGDLPALHPGGIGHFKPSAVAVDPLSNSWYILSASSPQVCRLNKGKLDCEYFDLPNMRQPEGMAFDAQGNLWIASEARGKRPYIFRFTRTTP